jgi:hypothetical protein
MPAGATSMRARATTAPAAAIAAVRRSLISAMRTARKNIG